MDERERIEQAIAAQESLCGTMEDAIIDAVISDGVIASITKQIADLDTLDQQRNLVTILYD